MNKIWLRFIKFLSPPHDGEDESQLSIQRLYCFFILLLTPLFVFYVFEFAKNRIVLDGISFLYFLSVFIGSYKSDYVKRNIQKFMYFGFLYVSLVMVWINYVHDFDLHYFLGMLIGVFSISLIMENHRYMIYYSSIIFVVSLLFLISLESQNKLDEHIVYYLSMLLCFIVVSYYVIRYRSLSNEQLVYNSSLLKSVFNDSPDGLLIVNKQSNIIENCSVSLIEMLKLSEKKDLIGMDYLSFSKKFKSGKKFFQDVFIHEEEKHKEEKYKDIDGNEIWVDQVVSNIQLESQSYFLIRLIHITQKKEAELHLQKLSFAVEQNPSIVIILNENGVIEYVNQTFEKATGYAKEDFIGENIISFGSLSEEENKKIINTVIQEGRWEGILRYKRANNQPLIEKAIFTKITNERGKVTHLIKISEDITDKVETEQTLKKVLENINEIVYSAKVNDDGSKRLDYISPLVSEMFGFSPEDYKQNKEVIFNSFHPEDKLQILEIQKKLLKNPKPCRYTYRFKHNVSKEYIWVEESMFPQLDENNKMIEVFGVVREITDRVEAQEKIKLSEERYRTLFSKANDAILIVEANKIIDCNDKAEEMFRCNRLEMIGASPFVFYPDNQPNGDDSILKAYEYMQSALNGESQFYYWKHWSQNGPQFDSEVSINSIEVEGKKLLQFIIKDITARKKAEESRTVVMDSYFELFNDSTDLIYMFNKDGYYINVNKSVEALHQFTKEEIIGKTFNFISADLLNDYKSMILDFQKVWETGNTKKFDWWGQKKDGTIVPMEIIMNKGSFLGEQVIIARGRDISERIQYEKTLIESEEKFKTLSYAAPIGIFQENKDGKTIYINQMMKDIFQVKDAEEFHQEWSNMIHPEDYDKVMSLVEASFNSKENGKYEYRVINKNNALIWIKVQISILMDVNAKVIGRVGTIEDVTARKMYESAIKESEERFKLLSDATIEGIALSQDGVILDVNDRFLEIYGYKEREEVIGKSIIDFTVKDEQHIISERLKQDKNEEKEFHHIRKDGEIITVESRAYTIPFNNKKVKVSVINDITKRKEAEENLRKSEDNYRRLVEILPDAILLHDNGTILFANPEAIKMMDADKEEDLLGKNLLDFVLQEDKKVVKERIFKVQQEGSQVKYNESRIRTKKGIKTIDSCAMPYLFNGKNVVRVVARDVTDKKRVEKEQLRAEIAEETTRQLTIEVRERKQTERKLKLTQEFMRSIIDSSLDMICAFDNQGNITEFNDAAIKIFGYKEKEISGLRQKDLFAREEEFDVIQNSLNEYGKYTGEIVNIRKNKEEFPSFISVSVLKNADGEVIGQMSVSRDITEMKQAEEDLKESLKEKEILLKEVHHRVKNNLQVISSILNLQSSYVEDEYTLDLLKECQNRIKSMSFIHESLYQSKNLSNVSFSSYIENLCNNLFYSYLVPNRRIGLSFDFEEVFLNLDTAIPCGLIVNELVSNALKYAFKDMEEGEVFVSLKPLNGNEYCLVVSDNGNGMPEGLDYMNTDSLGLQLVVTLVEQIRGTIDIKNENGVTFTILFKDIYK